MVSILIRNNQALDALHNDNPTFAQFLFRKNLRKYPCNITFHNLGIFYMQYGMYFSNGKHRGATKVGLRYLLKAASFHDNAQCLISAATALLDVPFQREKLISAHSLFCQAYLLQPSPITKYNIGVCLFHQKRFSEAADVFEELCVQSEINIITNEQGQNPQIVLANCYWFLQRTTDCLAQLSKIEYCGSFDSRPSVFSLKVLCGAYESALDDYRKLLEEWMPTEVILAALSRCLKFLPTHAQYVEKLIPAEFDTLWKELKGNEKLCEEKLNSYSYDLPIINMYHFLDE